MAAAASALRCPVSAWHRQPAGHGSRRGAFRASDPTDGRERKLPRHPIPGRSAQQEARGHLLAAGRLPQTLRRGSGGRRHLALSSAVRGGRHGSGPADVRLRPAALRSKNGLCRSGASGIHDHGRQSRRISPKRMPCCSRHAPPRKGALGLLYVRRRRAALAGAPAPAGRLGILPLTFWIAEGTGGSRQGAGRSHHRPSHGLGAGDRRAPGSLAVGAASAVGAAAHVGVVPALADRGADLLAGRLHVGSGRP